MINRAKCKLCNDVIESHIHGHVVYCKCGTIAVMDGPALRTYAKGNDYGSYFLRVDDMGNEMVVQYKQDPTEVGQNEDDHEPEKGVSKKHLIEEFEANIKNAIDRPDHVLASFVTTDELLRFMIDILNIIKRDSNEMD